MVIAIKFDCGCGFHTDNPVEATKHSIEKNHCLTISGEIKKSEVK